MSDPTPAERNQRAKVLLYPSEIAHLLGLPEGLRIVSVHPTIDPHSIAVVVEGGSLEPQHESVSLPALGGHFMRKTRLIDGEIWTRWEWTP